MHLLVRNCLPKTHTESRDVKLSSPLDPVGPDSEPPLRALQNPPLAVPNSGFPSHQITPVATDFLLTLQAHCRHLNRGQWRFALNGADGQNILEASDDDVGDLNRLTLLAAVRGLEALEGPSSVTIYSHSRYFIRSLAKSLPRWRRTQFVWEHFGRQIQVQHADLWQRIAHALDIHQVQACLVSSVIVSGGLDESAATQSSGDTRIASAEPMRQQGTSQQRPPQPPSPPARPDAEPLAGQFDFEGASPLDLRRGKPINGNDRDTQWLRTDYPQRQPRRPFQSVNPRPLAHSECTINIGTARRAEQRVQVGEDSLPHRHSPIPEPSNRFRRLISNADDTAPPVFVRQSRRQRMSFDDFPQA